MDPNATGLLVAALMISVLILVVVVGFLRMFGAI
jgi:hypothetical protein